MGTALCMKHLGFLLWFTLYGLCKAFSHCIQAIIQTNKHISFKLNDGSQRKFCTVLLKRRHKRLGLVLCIISQSKQNNTEKFFWSSNILCDGSSIINGNKIQVYSISSLRREWLFSIPKSIQNMCNFTWCITVMQCLVIKLLRKNFRWIRLPMILSLPLKQFPLLYA